MDFHRHRHHPTQQTRTNESPQRNNPSSEPMDTSGEFETLDDPEPHENHTTTSAIPELNPLTHSMPTEQTPQNSRLKSRFEIWLRDNNFSYSETIRQMVYTCCVDGDNYSTSEVRQYLNDELIEIFVDTVNMAMILPKRKLRHLSRQVSRLLRSFYSKKENRHRLRIPTTLLGIKRQILSDNKFSWRSILPIPKIVSIDGGHGYCPITELLGHITMTSHDVDYAAVKPRHRIWLQSKRFKKFRQKVEGIASQRKKVIVMFFIWSDGFDPNTSSKGNRGSVWAATVTFIFYDCDSDHIYMVKTAVTAIGRDKKDHTEFWKCIKKELSTIKQTFFSFPSHYHRTPGDVDFHLVCLGCLMDNPERRANFWLLSYNSKAHGMFSLNCRFDLLKVPFESLGCSHCREVTETYIRDQHFVSRLSHQCTRCLSFSLDRLIKEGEYSTLPVGKDSTLYQILSGPEFSQVPGGYLLFRPGFLSCDILRDGWNYVMAECVRPDSKWDDDAVKDYLSHLLCLNDSAIRRFQNASEEHRKYTIYLAQKELGVGPEHDQYRVDIADEVETKLREDSEWYKCVIQPNPIWDCFELHHAYETVMHNCMNIGKAVRDFLFSWATSHGLKKKLLDALDTNLTSIQSLHLEDFKARGVNTESFGGWVGENYRCFLWLGPWLLLGLKRPEFQISKPGEPAPAGRQMSSWNIKHFKNYLHDNLVRTVEVQEFDNEITPSPNNGSIEPPTQPSRVFRRRINWLKYRSWFETLSLMVKSASMSNRIGESLMEFTVVSPKNPRNVITKIRPIFSTTEELQGKEVYPLITSVSKFFSVLMDTSTQGILAQNRAQAYAIHLCHEFVNLYSRVSNTPCEDFRSKACLLGILRSTTHFGSHTIESHDRGYNQIADGDVPWLKSIHEGDDMGEGIVKRLRKMVPHGLRGESWQEPILSKFYRQESMDFVNTLFGPTEVLNGDEEIGGEPLEYQNNTERNQRRSLALAMYQSKKFRRYKNWLVFLEDVNNRKCLSLLAFSKVGDVGDVDSNIFLGFATTSLSKRWYVTMLEFTEEMAQEEGFLYLYIDGEKRNLRCLEIVDMEKMEVTGYTFLGFCIAMPHDKYNMFTVIRSDGLRNCKGLSFVAGM